MEFGRILTTIRLQCNEVVLGLFNDHWMRPRMFLGHQDRGLSNP